MAARRFVLVSYLRSGTHMLRTALESHPAAFCQTEVFNPDNKILPYPLDTPVEQVLREHVFKPHPPEVTHAGFVLHAYHPFALDAWEGLRANPAWAEVWPRLDAMDDLKVLHLQRRNLLRRHVSQLVARRSRFWHSWRAGAVDEVTHLDAPPHPDSVDWHPAERPVVTVDPERFARDAAEVERWRRRADDALGSRPRLVVAYEDLCADFEGQAERILDFLGLPRAPLRPAVSKLEERPLREAVSNYDGLRARFAGTPLVVHFDE